MSMMLYNASTKKWDIPWRAVDGAAYVTDGVNGIAQTRWIDVVHATLPLAAGTGAATYTSPGVRGPKVTSVRITAGTIPLTTTNWLVRCAIDGANDAADAIMVPVAEATHSATVNAGQITSFNLTPIIIPDYNDVGVADQRVVGVIVPPEGIYLGDPTAAIRRLGFVHNLGAGVTIQLGVSGVEEV